MMRQLVRYHSSIPDRFFKLLYRQNVPEVTSFAQHAQFGPGSSVDKIYSPSNLKDVFTGISSIGKTSKELSGLFGYPLFATDKGFYHCWFMCETHCDELVSKIVANPPSSETLRLFDDLSNMICIYADCVRFISENPPNKKTAQAAAICTINANNYVEKLNTNTELYEAIKGVSRDSAIMCELTEEDQAALRSFLHDMDLAGIHLPRESRDQYVSSMALIGAAGDRFVQLAHQPVKVRADEAPAALRDYTGSLSPWVTIPGPGTEFNMASVREFTWKTYNQYDEHRESELLNLLSHRHTMASNLGFTSFAERELRHTMAGSPAAVSSFLLNLHSDLAPLVTTELAHLKYNKAEDLRYNPTDLQHIYPSCGAYYPRVLNERFLVENHHRGDMYLDMLEIENVMEALNLFCEDVLRVSLVAEEPMRGEMVHQDVVKIAVFDEREGLIGYIYADLFERETKSPRTCLHTITCGTKQQIPAVVLQCSFLRRVKKLAGPENLSYPKINLDQLQTLFHEFGHALHAILGRTTYQATSGTRGPTDFAEIPSSLLENFISHPRVYSALISPLAPYSGSDFKHSYLFNTPYTALRTQTNILYSLIDQTLHSGPPPSSTCEVVDTLTTQYSHLTPVPDTAWHQRFSHLHYYGARYYSYLWSQSIANLIFYNMFYEDPFNEAAGIKLKEFLKRGSSVDFKSSLNELVGYDFGEEDMIGAITEPIREFNRSYLDTVDISKKWW